MAYTGIYREYSQMKYLSDDRALVIEALAGYLIIEALVFLFFGHSYRFSSIGR